MRRPNVFLRTWSVVAVAILLCGCIICPVRPMAEATDSKPVESTSGKYTADWARSIASALKDSLNLPAIQAAVWVDGRIVSEVNLGYADIEREIPLTSANLFRVGSVSKLLTATTALRLAQAGVLDLDAPCSRYLPSLPPDKAGITPRQLGGHLAGFGHYGRSDYINSTNYQNVSESLGKILSDSLLAPPGRQYKYSSYGFNVLGAVLQGAAQKDFPDVVGEQVLQPLGMEHTLVEQSASPPAERVHLYSRDDDGTLTDTWDADLTDRWPSGGFLSTAGDLVRFAGGILQDSFLDSLERATLLTSQRDGHGDETGVGLGWRISSDSLGRPYLHHGGDSMGGRAFLLVYPEQQVAVALLTNLTFARIAETDALRFAAPYLPR